MSPRLGGVVTPATDGAFSIAGITAGTYGVVAIHAPDGLDASDPSAFRDLASAARQIVVSQRGAMLTLTPVEQPRKRRR